MTQIFMVLLIFHFTERQLFNANEGRPVEVSHNLTLNKKGRHMDRHILYGEKPDNNFLVLLLRQFYKC